MNEQTSSDRADDETAVARKRPPAAGRGIVNPPKRVQELRLATIARALVSGLSTAAIMQAVHAAQTEEAAKRATARLSGASNDEAATLVPVVWGDVPIPKRTLEHYIRRAKDVIADEGRKVGRDRDYVIAIQLARCNELYQRSLAANKFHTALGVICEVNEMFGIREALKVLMLVDDRRQAAEHVDEADAQRENLKTEEGRVRAFARLVEIAATRDEKTRNIFARFAQLQNVAELPAISASTGNGSSGNGSAPYDPAQRTDE